MRTSRLAGSAMAVTAMLAFVSACCAAASTAEETTRIVVALLEPSEREREEPGLGYAVSIGESRLTTGDQLLNGLADTGGTHLAMIVREDVSIGTILTVASLASKAGFLHYSVFIFDRGRKGMVHVPSFKWFDFSTDSATVGGLIR